MKNALLNLWQRIGWIFFIISFVLLCALLIESAMYFSQPKGRVSCTSFGSYDDALRAYSAGATWLDHDGDGIPCEELYKAAHLPSHGE